MTFYFYYLVKEEDVIKAQLGLGHSYSRANCMFDVNRQDKPVIQSIALIDQLDKNINSFCMRIKEWFSWHFPELNRIVSENSVFVKVVHLIQTRNNLNENAEELREELENIVVDPDLVKQIIEASPISMGQDLNDSDLVKIYLIFLVQYKVLLRKSQ